MRFTYHHELINLRVIPRMATPGQGDVIGKKPVIRPYARARMAERNVSQEAVEWVLEALLDPTPSQ